MPEEKQNSLLYAEEAAGAFYRIMSSGKKDMMEDISRTSKGELFVLHFLAAQKAAVLPSELSIALRASTARVSALLGALEKKGQIVRDIDTSNRRNILVTITEEGRARVEAEMQAMKDGLTRVFADMGEADTAEFLRLSRRFSELLQRYGPSKEGRPSEN